MKPFKHHFVESTLHPQAVHAYPDGKNSFKVHAVGSGVKHVKPGDNVTSSDLDDLTSAGHKVKEVKKPKALKEEDLEEVSKDTLSRYVKAAHRDKPKQDALAKDFSKIGHDARADGHHDQATKFFGRAGSLAWKANNRTRGIDKAVDKLAK